MFGGVCFNTYVTLSDRRMILDCTLLNKNITTVVIILRNIRIKNQIITAVKVIARLTFIKKVSNMLCTRFNVGNECRNSSKRMMKLMKTMIIMGKTSERNTRTRRNIRSNTIM